MYETIGHMLTRSANKFPDKDFFVWEEGACTYSQMNGRVNKWASLLEERGVGPGERVCLLFYNGTPIVETMWAIFKLGATAVPLNFRLSRKELEALVTFSEAGWFVASEEFEEITRGILEDSKEGKGRIIFQKESSAMDDGSGSGSVSHSDGEPSIPCRYSDPALILYTAGTTAMPKGVLLTHGNLIWNAFHLITANSITNRDVVLHPSPLFHSAALGRMMAVMMMGGTFITLKKFDPERTLRLIQDQRVTMMAAAPTMYHSLFQVSDVDDYELGSVRACVSGASQLQPDLLEGFKNYFSNAQLFNMYGLTEASPSCTVLAPELAFKKPGSVGKPVPGVELRLVDDDGKDVEQGEVGEIIVRGPNVTTSYWNSPEATAETIRGGWLHTGDMARTDDEGDVYIVDRKKDIIITGGENVYSLEVENVLRSHPKVSEVAVIGLPDEKWGESICAVVVLRKGEKATREELVDHCLESLARYKKPRSIEFVDELPKNPAGKVIKKELRAMLLEGSG